MRTLSQDSSDRAKWFRLSLLPAVFAIAVALIFVLHLDRYLTLHSLASHREWLIGQVAQHPALTAIGFVAIYLLATVFSLPGSSILTMAGGFLFGLVFGAMISVAAATLGAIVLFVIARTSFAAYFQNRVQGTIGKLRSGFAKSALSYLLFLRLVPIFPFWLVNLAAALLDVRLRTFVLGTFFGIIPGAAVYASIGSGLGEMLDRGQTPDLGAVFQPSILIPLLALAVLSLAPVAYRRWKPA
ncbi:MAG: TVP38/TMEM64 family protein [Proteobacteria bacterium]|nr:TVP38/TMEM64 family protein [Pseudomonadota bacterium]